MLGFGSEARISAAAKQETTFAETTEELRKYGRIQVSENKMGSYLV